MIRKEQLWESFFGNAKVVYDAFGRKMTIEEATVDHIWPIKKGGSGIEGNLILLSKESNNEKGIETKGEINNKRFWVIKQITSEGEIYGVLYVDGEIYY